MSDVVGKEKNVAPTRPEMSKETKALKGLIKRLTEKEERSAIDAARSHLYGELSERYRFFPAELRIEKSSRSKATIDRSVAVLMVDYERRRTIELLIDAKGKVVRVTDLSGFQPAFLDEEVKEAREIAERDDRVARATRVRGTFVSAFGPDPRGAPGARLVGLRYATVDKKGHGRLLGEAIVDLSQRLILSFEDLGREEGH